MVLAALAAVGEFLGGFLSALTEITGVLWALIRLLLAVPFLILAYRKAKASVEDKQP